jgi:hypothetical protein
MEKWLSRRQIQDVKCPRCWAKPGRWCTDERGPRPTSHPERLEYALVLHGRRPLGRVEVD